MSVHREEIIQAALQDVEIGAPVRTSDGVELGLVKEIEGDFIKVDAPLRADYWVNADYVLSAGADGVQLSFAKSDLGAYKRDKPGLLDDEDPLSSEAAVDLVIDEDEQMEQRVRMERQLAEQRRDLPHTHPDGKGAPPDTGGTVGEPVEAELDRLDPDSEFVHDDDDTAPEFMTKSDARAIVGLESDSPLVAPVQSATPATYGEPPAISDEVASTDAIGTEATRALDSAGKPGVDERHSAASVITEEYRSTELESIEAQSDRYEPAAATPASPATSAQSAAWGEHAPGVRSDEMGTSAVRRVLMMGAGLAILLGVGFGGYAMRRRVKHRA